MRTSLYWQLPAVMLGLLLVVGCDGEDSDNCRIIETDEETSTIRCPDGSRAVIEHGKPGEPGRPGQDGGPHPNSCSLTDNEDGTATLSCGSREVVIHRDCPDGYPGDLVLGDGYYYDETASVSYIAFQLAGCTEVQGNVSIDGYEGTSVPAAVARIERIGGSLNIGMENGNENLENISFPLLRSIGGFLNVGFNDSLTHLGDFTALTELTGLDIYYNNRLEELGAFPALEEIAWVYVSDNTALESVDGLFSIQRITESIQFRGNCVFDNSSAEAWAEQALVPTRDDTTFFFDPVGCQ